MRHRIPLLLAATAAAVVAVTASDTCGSREACCHLCGDGAMRCARGPCSSSFWLKGIFSVSAPTSALGFWDVVFVFYGMVPYLVPMFLALTILLYRRTWTLVFGFLFIPIFAVVNAGILVPSLGSCAKCLRPCGACVTSNGMPSGHASNAIGIALWLLLEGLLGFGRRWSGPRKAAWSAVTVLLFVPVPYSRVYLGDHTPLQVTIGSANGLVFGVLYFVVLRKLLARRLRQRCCGIAIVNDYSPEATEASEASQLLETALVDRQESAREEEEAEKTVG